MQGVLRTGRMTGEPPVEVVSDDAELVALAQANPRSFELLYHRYVNPVHRYCYRRLGNREAAEDATSLVFTKAFTALPNFHSGSFRSWLFTIAYHVIADDLRARRPTLEIDAAAALSAVGPSPEDFAVLADSQRTVTALLARLPDGQRQVIELRLAGLTGGEIARVLGRSLPAVKIAQLRGYARLRDLLAPKTDPEAGHAHR
jgi:RNA polymerase sigma factor (sigma-70 family)